jgi:hypothetical protein
VQPSKPSRIYSQLVETKNDFVGILAYSVYKRQKNEVIEKYKDQGDDVLQAELEHFHNLCNETQLNYFRTEAEKLAQNFAQAALEEQLQEYEQEYEQRLKNELRTLKPRFWTGVWQSVIGGFIFVLVLGLLVFFSWSLKQGPKELIESIFDVKITHAGPVATPTPQ